MKVRVEFGSADSQRAIGYDVRIGAGVLATAAEEIAPLSGAHRYVIIADDRVAELYAAALLDQMRQAQLAVDLFTFPAGEENKTRASWTDLSDRMLEARIGRDAAVLALGGGVTGDLAGFVAATYLRGLPVVQLPTTLLAMIDSSVGGKTGVDTPAGKNLIGSFHQPLLVLADTDTLNTLPTAEIRSGLAEAVKHGAIADADYFEWIADSADLLLGLDSASLVRLIGRSVEIKAEVVGADEREGGLRKTLNFGHTIGHAIEALSQFRLLHGEAVAIGMVVEAEIGELLGVTATSSAERLRHALKLVELPTSVPAEFSIDRILELTRVDKKAREGHVEYSLVEEIGKASAGTGAYGIAVEDRAVVEALERCRRNDFYREGAKNAKNVK